MVVKHIESKEEFDGVLNGGSPNSLVVVDYYAQWCGPCKRIAPIIEEMSNTYSNVTFVKVDVDELEEIARAQSINAMPTFKLYKAGKQVDELVGASAEKLKQLIEKNK